MAVLVTANVAGGDAKQDAAIQERLGLNGKMPSGGILRLAGPADGGWRIVSVWESKEAFERFRTDKLGPAMREAGLQPPQIEIWSADQAILPSA